MNGILDLSDLAGRGVFEKLTDPDFMRQLYIDRETGTIAWPGGLDLDRLCFIPKFLANLSRNRSNGIMPEIKKE
jgi:hypothetical protein